MSKRKTTKSQRGKVVLDRVHLPEEHYQPGAYVDVTVDGAVVTIKPVMVDLGPIPASHGLDVPA